MRILFLIKKPIFTVRQFDRLSNIFDNAGQVIFGIAVLSPIIPGVDRINVLVVVLSLITVLVCWVASVWLAKRGEEL